MRLLLLSTSLSLFAGIAATQAPAPTVERKLAPGDLTPADALIWVSWQELGSFAERLGAKPAGLALTKWQEQGGEVATEWRSFAAGLAQYVESLGVHADLVASCVQRGGTVAVHFDGTRLQFTGHLAMQGHGEAIEIAIQAYAREELGQALAWKLPLPLGYPGELWLRRHDDLLCFASSRAALDLVSALHAQEGAPLSADPDFDRALQAASPEDAKGEVWLTSFVRPGALATARLLPEEWKQGTPWQLGAAEALGIVWSSRFDGENFEDSLGLALRTAEKNPLHAIPAAPLSKELAHLVPRLAERFVLANLDGEALLKELDESGVRLPGGFTLQELELQLLSKQLIQSRDALEGLIGNDIVIVGDPRLEDAPLVSLALADAFRVGQLLQELGQKRSGRDDVEFDLYELPGQGRSYFATIVQDRLYVGENEKLLLAWLADIEQGQVHGDALATVLATRRPALWIHESPRCWMLHQDADQALGLAPLADDADLLAFGGHFGERTLTLRTQSATGPLPVLGIALAHTLPAVLQHPAAQNEDIAQRLAEEIANAERAWLTLAETRPDTATRSANLTELVQHQLLRAQAHELIEGHVLLRDGYKHRLMLDDDTPENWLVLSWPAEPGISGRASFVLDARQGLHRHAWIDQLDEKLGPLPHQIFVERPFASALAQGWAPPGGVVTVAAQPDAPAHEAPVPSHLPLAQALELVDAFAQKKDLAGLRELLARREAPVQARAAHRLGELGDRESLPALARLARESLDVELRRRATWALSRMRDPRTDATMLGLLNDEDAQVRVFAVQGLSTSKTPGVDEALFGLVQGFPRDEAGERSLAVLILTDRRAPGLLHKLATISASTPRFGEAVTCSFQTLGSELEPDQERPLLLAALSSPIERLRFFVVERLAAQGHSEAVPALVAQLEKEQGPLATRIQEALAVLAPDPAIDFEALWAKAKSEGAALWARFRQLEKPVQLGLLLAPLLLLMGVTMLRLRRRSRRLAASGRDILGLVQPSEELLALQEQELLEDPETDAGFAEQLDDVPGTFAEADGLGIAEEEEERRRF